MDSQVTYKIFGKILSLFRLGPQSLLNVVEAMTRCQPILLDYPVKLVPRYGYGIPPHLQLYKIINKKRHEYENTLTRFLEFKEYLLKIPSRTVSDALEPCWINDYLPGLDSVALYSLLTLYNPKKLIEIGSGYSTKFARRAIVDHNLQTKIISIDPLPRAEIDLICDSVIRQPLEDIDITFFNKLESGDFLYVDGSHRCFTNSDVTVVFLDILPQLKPGVIVEFHDISLPYDYSVGFSQRYYSEQYLLAVYIMSNNDKFNIILPNSFINEDLELSGILNPLWDEPHMLKTDRRGCSFWIQIR
jgi:hypothetical protein